MLVRQAAKDGRIPVKWDIKKHHRFFPWIGTHIHSRRRTERAGEPRAGGTKEGRPQKGKYDGSPDFKHTIAQFV